MKKDAMLPPLRIPSEMKDDYFKALDFYGFTRPAFARFTIACLISKYKRGEVLEFRYGDNPDVESLLPVKSTKQMSANARYLQEIGDSVESDEV